IHADWILVKYTTCGCVLQSSPVCSCLLAGMSKLSPPSSSLPSSLSHTHTAPTHTHTLTHTQTHTHTHTCIPPPLNLIAWNAAAFHSFMLGAPDKTSHISQSQPTHRGIHGEVLRRPQRDSIIHASASEDLCG